MAYTRVAIAQIRDWNTFPELPSRQLILGGLRPDSQAQNWLNKVNKRLSEMRDDAQKLLRERAKRYFDAIINFCNRRDVHILVFPECSIELAWLPGMSQSLKRFPIPEANGPSYRLRESKRRLHRARSDLKRVGKHNQDNHSGE